MRYIIDRIFCILQTVERKWEYSGEEHQLLTDLKKAYDSVRREVSYNVLINFGVIMQIGRLIKIC